jgi:hypothetical protein
LLLFARIKEESEQTIHLQVVLPAQVCLILQINGLLRGQRRVSFHLFLQTGVAACQMLPDSFALPVYLTHPQ